MEELLRLIKQARDTAAQLREMGVAPRELAVTATKLDESFLWATAATAGSIDRMVAGALGALIDESTSDESTSTMQDPDATDDRDDG